MARTRGRFVAALLGVMQRLARLAAATQASLETTAQQAHATTLAELESVRELRRTVEAVRGQAQAAQILSVVEREHAVQRMIERTLPLFADRLRDALVLREARWNADQARKTACVGGPGPPRRVRGRLRLGDLGAARPSDDGGAVF